MPVGTAAQQTSLAQVPGRYAVREARSTARSEWDGWLERSPGGGHIYQSYEWGEFKRRLGWAPVRLVMERDGEVAGLGQFLCWRPPFMPGKLLYATKGPWLPWEDEQAVRTFFNGVRKVAEREGAHTVKIEPEVLEQRTDVKKLLRELGFRKFRWDLNGKTTMTIDLSPSEEELLAKMKGKTRYNIGLAARKGVKVVEDNSPEAREHLLRMARVTAERDGFVIRRPDDYSFALQQSMYDAGRAHLFFATHEGDRLAAMFICTFGRKYWYTAGASTNEKRNLMPAPLLQWEVMRWAKRHGLTYYDMVGIPKPRNLENETDPLYGVYKFKVGFGGEVADFLGCWDLPVKPVPARWWNRMEPVYYRLYYRLKRNIYY